MTAEVAESKSQRGRETAGDMVRSLGLVLLAVVAIWYLAQPPASDVKEIRVVDPSGSIAAFARAAPAAPVPGALPAQWRPTSSAVGDDPASLRVGYVTPSGQYAEYAASTAPRETSLPELTGARTDRLGTVQVAGGVWEQLRDGDGSLSLVRSFGGVTVVVGTLRASAPLEELRTLAASLATR